MYILHLIFQNNGDEKLHILNSTKALLRKGDEEEMRMSSTFYEIDICSLLCVCIFHVNHTCM